MISFTFTLVICLTNYMVFKNLHTPQEIVNNNHIRRYKVCTVDMISGRSQQLRCHAHSACLDHLTHDFIIFRCRIYYYIL